ncbi:hypothetical protein [Anaerobaca lacustris]|uniref:VPLPA-CTERM sorting domain-containing protein n=1 Tax=Anaerobaca lacustris TaxID=3044600 RepID=A0AAW6TWK9_9BACT|nr:hypothetical protein [Sedimentisphaerales bacterium M17dextr]
MKKFSIAVVVACLMALTAGTVFADMIPGDPDFVDTKYFNQWIGTGAWFYYTHAITGPYTPIPDAYTVDPDSVKLEITYYDGGGRESIWQYAYGEGEWHFLGSTGSMSGYEDFEFQIDADWLNSSGGSLTVALRANSAYGSDSGTYLKRSVLSGDVSVVPVPGAVLLGVLGLGAAGMKLRRRNAA